MHINFIVLEIHNKIEHRLRQRFNKHRISTFFYFNEFFKIFNGLHNYIYNNRDQSEPLVHMNTPYHGLWEINNGLFQLFLCW